MRFSIDDWLHRLYFPDQPPTERFEWFYERVQRIGRVMREMGEQVIGTGRPVVYDCGFTNRIERQKFYDWADAHGFPVILHFIDTPRDLRWERTQRRNAEKGPTFMFEVTRDMFDFIERLWEPPTADEVAERHAVRIEP